VIKVLPVPGIAGLAGLVVLGGSLAIAAVSAGAAPSFTRATSYATGPSPNSVAIGDMNGDGRPDLATASGGVNGAPNIVSVLLNTGDGGFPAKRVYATGFSSMSVAIGDLNGDRMPDVATANAEASTVSVLLNRGDGRFMPKRDYPTGLEPFSVAIGDLNGDGRSDLATANGGGNVSILLSRGGGSFEAKRDYPAGGGSSSVAIGDLNGDGRPDLATANGEGEDDSVSVLVNDGAGGFRAKADYRAGSSPVDLAIGDLNGDGKPDLATANLSASTASVLLNRGNGSFRVRRDYATGVRPTSVAIGDLNGDGKPELAITNSDQVSAVSVLANRGDGSFEAKIDHRTGRFTQEVAIGDLNGDGRPDLATANLAVASVSVLLNRPGLCTVQNVRQTPLPAAKRTIARANCRIGRIRRAYSSVVRRDRVISQKPRFGAVLRGGGKVDLVVSRGRGPS
jgi:hypothetical protein